MIEDSEHTSSPPSLPYEYQSEASNESGASQDFAGSPQDPCSNLPKTNRNHSKNHDQIMTQPINSAKGREELINTGFGN